MMAVLMETLCLRGLRGAAAVSWVYGGVCLHEVFYQPTVDSMVRLSALTTPEVTVGPPAKTKGFPIA